VRRLTAACEDVADVHGERDNSQSERWKTVFPVVGRTILSVFRATDRIVRPTGKVFPAAHPKRPTKRFQQDRYQFQASLPKDVTAEVVLPPEAKAVWQSAPANDPWRETLTVRGESTIVVTPGKVEVR
jgi:hypothetical protein